MQGKTCSKCGEFKELSAFNTYKNKKGIRAHRSYCKSCQSVMKKKWYYKNQEYASEYRRKWYQENAERERENSRRWRKENPEKHVAQEANRRALKHALPYSTSSEMWLDVMSNYNCKCAVTGKVPFDLEHAIPLSWGWGSSLKDNIYPMDKTLNNQKSNKNPFKFLKQLKGQQRANFEQVLRNLAKENGLTYKEYREFVYWCEKHKRTLEEVIEDNKLGLSQVELWKIRSGYVPN